jgi:protein-S-isoprenylcysteine O-methyltransferase Ste14
MSYLPLAGTLLLFAMVFVWRPWLQRRRQGIWGIVMLIVLPLLLLGQAALAAWWPDALALSEADRRAAPGARIALGTVLLFGGLLLQAAAMHQSAMPGLVTSGLYRFSRNPIFLALLAALAGYMLLLPTLLSAAILIGAYLAIRQQIAEEETCLARAYGDQYREYAHRVGRLLPGIGKLD